MGDGTKMKPMGYNPDRDKWNYRDYYLWIIAETLHQLLEKG